MAVVTRRPSRTSSRIQAAPTYEGVAASFASAFQSALKNERIARFNNMVTAYSDGGISFDEFKNFVNGYIEEVGQNTSEGSDALKTLVKMQDVERGRSRENKRTELEAKYASSDGFISEQDRYRIESEMLSFEKPGTTEYTKQQQNIINSFENAQVEMVEQRRAELFEQYMAGGITPQEELAIIRELKTVANPESKIYRSLVQQEAQAIKGTQTGNTTGLQNEFSFFLADELANHDAIVQAHKLGEVDGLTRAETQFDSAEKIYTELAKLAQQGVNVPEEALQNARNMLNSAKILIDAYNNGQVFDVISKDGSVKTVTVDGRDPFTGQNVDFMAEPVQQNSATGLWEVVDQNGNVVEGSSALSTRQAALSRAKELGLDTSFTAVVRNPNGEMEKVRARREENGSFTIFDTDANGNEVPVNLTSIPSRMDLMESKPDIFKVLNLADQPVPENQIPKIQAPVFDQATGEALNSASSFDKLFQSFTGVSLFPDPNKLDLGMGQGQAARDNLTKALQGQNLGFDVEGNVTQAGQTIKPVTFRSSEIAKDVALTRKPTDAPFGSPTSGDLSASSLQKSLAGRDIKLSGPTFPTFASGGEVTQPFNQNSISIPEVSKLNFDFNIPMGATPSTPSMNFDSSNLDLGLDSFSAPKTTTAATSQPSFFQKAKDAASGLFNKFLGLFK